jgi:hypothetical protein
VALKKNAARDQWTADHQSQLLQGREFPRWRSTERGPR